MLCYCDFGVKWLEFFHFPLHPKWILSISTIIRSEAKSFQTGFLTENSWGKNSSREWFFFFFCFVMGTATVWQLHTVEGMSGARGIWIWSIHTLTKRLSNYPCYPFIYPSPVSLPIAFKMDLFRYFESSMAGIFFRPKIYKPIFCNRTQQTQTHLTSTKIETKTQWKTKTLCNFSHDKTEKYASYEKIIKTQ